MTGIGTFLILLSSAAISLGAAHYFLPQFVKRYGVKRLKKFCMQNRVLALTYDDGVDELATARVLSVLAEQGASATFFPIGSKIHKLANIDPDRLSVHSFGSHGYEHFHAWKTMPWTAAFDAVLGHRALNALRPGCTLFRPPYGKVNLLSLLAAKMHDMRFAWWTLDSGDTWPVLPAPQRIVESVLASGGGVVLLHDRDRDDLARMDYVETVTRLLLLAASEAGIRIVTMDELLKLEHSR
jgi:peptidoglycan/xylan/chitin deacetylase (PgdA/CDA1 family)